jgi:hypothetical protein
MNHPSKKTIGLSLVLAGLLGLPSLAGAQLESSRNTVALLSAGAGSVEWLPQVIDYSRLTLRISGPNGQSFQREFAAGQTPSFSLFDALGSRLADGQYSYEIRVVPQVSKAVREQLKAARAAGDDKAIAAIQAAHGLDREIAQSGIFILDGGSPVLAGSATEAPAGKPNGKGGRLQSAAQPGLTSAPLADQVIPDDLIVQGSACIGLDCVNNESFGFDTIRLKENNTRIKFEDTSVGSFPSNDWQLTANDSTSGNRFSIDDITGSRTPFTITAGAPTNSLFLDSSGRVGFGTSTPVLNLHVSKSDTPALRLEQTSAGGFTAQTWDVAGNEANFFVRDVTGGSRLPFRIRPGAPTSSVDISADGDVGIGTASPGEKLHVLESGDANTISLVQNTNATGTSAAAVVRTQADVANISFIGHGSGRTLSRFGQVLGGWGELVATAGSGLAIGTLGNAPLIIGTNNANRIQIGGTGGVTVTGNFTVTGGTKNFAVVDPADSKKALYYAALEGPEAGTYYRGTARTHNGEIVIELPGHFSRLTEAQRMTVQLTPVGGWGQLYVAERTPEKLVVRTAPGSADLEFDYLVQGVRKGYLDFEVERQNDLPR